MIFYIYFVQNKNIQVILNRKEWYRASTKFGLCGLMRCWYLDSCGCV